MSRDRNSTSSSSDAESENDKSSRNNKCKTSTSKTKDLDNYKKDNHRRSHSRQRSYSSRKHSRSRSRERNKSRNDSRKHKSKYRRRDRSRDFSPITEKHSRHRRNGSHNRHTSRRSNSREKYSKRRRRSRSSSSRDSRSSYHSRRGKRRSHSSSDSEDSKARSGSIVKSDMKKKRSTTHLSAEITNRIAKAVEQAASAVLTKITNASDSLNEPIVIDDDVINEINDDSFISKPYISKSNKVEESKNKKTEETLELTVQPEQQNEECLIHPNLIIDDSKKMKNWIKNLNQLRIRLQNS